MELNGDIQQLPASIKIYIPMKQIIILFFILTRFAVITYSQDSLSFKSKYLPEKKYNQTIEQISNTELSYFGPDEFLEKLKNKGIQNPTITNKTSFTECVIKTGSLTDKSIFPLTMEFVKITGSDGKQAMPDGTILYGNISGDNMPVFDSISMAGIDDEIKNSVLQFMQSLNSQLNFPEKKLNVGDEFIRESPLSVPISDVTVEMAITTKYKLKSILDDIALFDILQIYTMESAITKYIITANGNGTGQLFYDIKNNFYLRYLLDTNFEMNAKLDNFSINVYSKTNFIQNTSITKN